VHCAGEFFLLDVRGRNVLEDNGSASNQRDRSWHDVKCGDAVLERATERRILDVDPMLNPNARSDWTADFADVGIR
jgi:hypothetical protein